MRIPSYDDLTPSIPDVAPRERMDAMVRLLPPADRARAEATREGPARVEGDPVPLFACLRSRQLEAIAGVAQDFSPRIQRYAGEAVVLDVSGLGRLLGPPDTIAAEIARLAAARGLPDVRLAVAPTQVSALLLSLAEAVPPVVTADASLALAPLPVQRLQQLMAGMHGAAVLRKRGTHRSAPARVEAGWPAWPACEYAFDVFRRWGLQTLGELAALPAGDLAARLGRAGIALQRLAGGLDPAPLVPDPTVQRFIERLELEWPLDSLEPLSFVLARLLEPLAAALARADRAAAALRLDLRLVNRTTHARVLQLPAAMRDPRVLRTLLLLDLESHPPSEAIDIVVIEADPAPGRVIQYSLLERALPSAETVATLTARLAALVGASRCGSPELLDTHRPDGFALRGFSPPSQSRPCELLAPAALATCLRRFRPPVAVRVDVDRGRPARVAIDRRGMPGGRVVQAAGPWRSSGAWWDNGRGPWNRDEWDVELSDGSICRLFREQGTWFLEGVVD